MSRRGDVRAVLSKDSNMAVLYMCQSLISHWDRSTGEALVTGSDQIRDKIDTSVFCSLDREILFKQMLDTCILGGCDYL